MKLVPFRGRGEVASFRSEFDEFMNRFFRADFDSRLPAPFTGGTVPAVDIAESLKHFTVSVELPGLNEKDIQVQLVGNTLRISAERKWEEEQKDRTFHRVESQYGSFQRTITLPENARLQSDAITAQYRNGMLELNVPKVEPTPIAKIPVKAG